MLKGKENEKVWILDATDRCDRCYAQAYVKRERLVENRLVGSEN